MEEILTSKSLFGHDSESDDELLVNNQVELKFDSYTRKSDDESLTLALSSSHHSLWGEFIYNAARILADMIDTKQIDCYGKKCLELGAGAGLPSMIAYLNHASVVIISDYGNDCDDSLIRAISHNISYIQSRFSSSNCRLIRGVGYVWGNNTENLFYENNKENKFDYIFLADLLFNRSEHRRLLWTVKECLAREGQAIITFSHHDPKKSNLDMNFFTLAMEDEFGFEIEKIGQEQRSSYPFVENDGLDDQRGIVYIYRLKLKN